MGAVQWAGRSFHLIQGCAALREHFVNGRQHDAGARDEAQLQETLGALGWQLTSEQSGHLDAASLVMPPYPCYPYWNGQFAERSPLAV